MNSKIFDINYQEKDLEIYTKYVDNGKELIIFIHGLGCTKESFDDVFDFPQFGNFSLLTMDLVGFGDSSKPQDFSYTMKEQAGVCKLLLDKVNPNKIHIVAHSMGGAIGLLLAEKTLNKLVSFTNIEGNLIGEDCWLSKKVISVKFKKFKDKVFDELKLNIGKLKDKGTQLWIKWCEKSDALAFYRSSISLVKWSDSRKLLEKFRRLKTRKVYIYGDKNLGMKILNELGNIEKIVISGSGHFVMSDNPEEFYTKLAEFISRQAN